MKASVVPATRQWRGLHAEGAISVLSRAGNESGSKMGASACVGPAVPRAPLSDHHLIAIRLGERHVDLGRATIVGSRS